MMEVVLFLSFSVTLFPSSRLKKSPINLFSIEDCQITHLFSAFDFILLFRNLPPSIKIRNRHAVFLCTRVTEHDFNLQVVSKFLPAGVIAHRHH